MVLPTCSKDRCYFKAYFLSTLSPHTHPKTRSGHQQFWLTVSTPPLACMGPLSRSHVPWTLGAGAVSLPLIGDAERARSVGLRRSFDVSEMIDYSVRPPATCQLPCAFSPPGLGALRVRTCHACAGLAQNLAQEAPTKAASTDSGTHLPGFRS